MSEFIRDFANIRFYYTPNGNCHLFVSSFQASYAIEPEEMDSLVRAWIEMRLLENEHRAQTIEHLSGPKKEEEK